MPKILSRLVFVAVVVPNIVIPSVAQQGALQVQKGSDYLILAQGRHYRSPGADLNSLEKEMAALDAQGKITQAITVAERLLALAKLQKGPDSLQTSLIKYAVAKLYHKVKRYSDAEALYLECLALYESGFDQNDEDYAIVGTVFGDLGNLYVDQSRYQDAEAAYKRAFEIRTKKLGPNHPATNSILFRQAELLLKTGRETEARPILERLVRTYENAFGDTDPRVAITLTALGVALKAGGDFDNAERAYKRAISIIEASKGADHLDVAAPLNNLANLFKEEGKLDRVEPLYVRVIEILERNLGREHQQVSSALNNLGSLHQERERYVEAEAFYRRALLICIKNLGPDHLETLKIEHNLAGLLAIRGRHQEAGPLFMKVLTALERKVGPDSLMVGTALNYMGFAYSASGLYAEAEPLLARDLAIRMAKLGADHPETANALGNLAQLYRLQGNWASAVDFGRRAASILIQRAPLGLYSRDPAIETSNRRRLARQRFPITGLIQAAMRQSELEPSGADNLAKEMFAFAQWGQSSEAASALTQMAARSSSSNPALATVVRERKDLATEWQIKDALLLATKGELPQSRNSEAERLLSQRLAAIERSLSAIDARLSVEFPDFAALSQAKPLTVAELQNQLRDDEGLILFLDVGEEKPIPEETFIWVVTKTDVRWVRSDLGSEALTWEVQALRCGLDKAAWDGPRCEELTGQHFSDADRNAGKQPPFDHARAYMLYKALFGQIEDVIKGKHLLIVPAGPLTQLPFQVLTTAEPKDGAPPAWLVRDHALTVLPAVSSLKALRRVARPSAAAKPLIGFGNPLLDGPSSAYASLAQLARDNKTCAAPSKVQVASAEPRGLPQVETRGGFADVQFLRMQAPLPETADELCAVARDVHADAGDIYLGDRAKEKEVKRLSETGQLAQYRIVHFATHGALAGEVRGTAEPGLILTPPTAPSETDDGYLTASEIATLKFDADWVILSACNTAAGGEKGAEALSGLARAFIYAQARALLVSHWAVNSEATVKLITGAMSRLAADQTMGRAEAMRQSMLVLIDKGGAEAHPAFWAPFVVVGEGGARR